MIRYTVSQVMAAAIAAVEAEDAADVERRLRSIGPPPSDDDEGGDRPRPARARRDLER